MADGSFLERIGSLHSILRNEPPGMYHTTGFTKDQVAELCAQVHAANEVAAEPEKITWPPILGLFKSVVVALTYLRRNRVQAEIGDAFGVPSPRSAARSRRLRHCWTKRSDCSSPPPMNWMTRHSTWSTGRCCRAGHGLPTRNYTRANIKLPA
jgi:hypothetical protein